MEARWSRNLRRDGSGAPLIPPRFVLESGSDLQIADVRPLREATGPLGYLPGSLFLSGADLDALARNSAHTPLVLVDAQGRDAAALARRLEAAGAPGVAAMAGGLAAWRGLGFLTSRREAGVCTELPKSLRPRPSRETPSAESLRTYLSTPGSVQWVQLASLQFYSSHSCMDGRDGRGVVGTPGGDAGEFALVLAAVESLTGATLRDEDIHSTLLAHLDTFGDFYWHTDMEALQWLHASLRADPATSGGVPDVDSVSGWAAYLHTPPPEAHASLLAALVQPESIGCGHLRLSLEHAADYGVRPELVQAVLRSFFRLLWAGSPELRPVILEGGHQETAVVSMRLAEEAWALAPVPVTAPHHEGTQMFVNHPDVSHYTRHTYAAFHCRHQGPLPVGPEDYEALCARIDELGAQQLTQTLGHLARGLPIFEACLPREADVRVEQIG